MAKAGLEELFRAQATAGLARRLQDEDGPAGLRQRDGGRQAVGSGPDDNRVIAVCRIAPRERPAHGTSVPLEG